MQTKTLALEYEVQIGDNETWDITKLLQNTPI